MIFPIPVIHLGPLVVQLPGLVILLGFWLALWISARAARSLGFGEDDVYTPGWYAAIAGLLGARLWYAAWHWEAYAGDPLGLISLNLSALDATGGLVIGALAGIGYARRRRLLSARWLDALTPGAALFLAAASLANLFSGEAYGTPSTLPWSIELWDMERHPTQVYELLALLVSLAIVWIFLRRRTAPGTTALLFLALYCGQRVFLEAFRADSVIWPGGWRAAQVMNLIGLGVSLALLKQRVQHHKLEIEPNSQEG